MSSFAETCVDYSTYLQKCEEAGIQVFEPLSIRHVVNVGEEERGVFCPHELKDESIICAIPFEQLLSVEIFDSTPLASLKDAIPDVDNQLALLVCYEKGLGGKSMWGYHFEVCPQFYHSVLNWSDDELEMLDGTRLYEVAIAWRRQAQDDFRAITKALKKSTVTEIASSYTTWFTLERYLWALSTIFSRFVTIRRNEKTMYVMAPLFDLFNHSFTGSKAMHGFREEADSLIIVSVGDHAAGEEIYLNYGALNSHTLLMKYGMVFENNPYDTVDIFAPLSPDAPHYKAKSDALLAYGINCNRPPFPMRPNELPTLLLAALRVQRADENELTRADEAIAGMPLSRKNEEEVVGAIETAVRAMLDGMCGNAEEDEAKLERWGALGSSTKHRGAEMSGASASSSSSPSEREKQATLFRHLQRKLLRSVLGAVDQYRGLFDDIFTD